MLAALVALALSQTTVTAPKVSDDEATGAYAQPGWTTHRRFPTTRVYVAPEGTAEFEWWFEGRFERGGRRVRSLWELEFGLGHRLQLDFYLRFEETNRGFHRLGLESEKVELRYAFANWGVIPGNPAVYLEWTHDADGINSFEGKLLLAGALAPRWHWGVNAIVEQHLNSTFDREYNATAAVGYSVVDATVSLGAEALFEASDSGGVRLAELVVLAGPSLQWRPIARAHVDVVALVGSDSIVGLGALAVQPMVVFGWQL